MTTRFASPGYAPSPPTPRPLATYDIHLSLAGIPARITVIAADPAPVEEARARLEALTRLWSPGAPTSDLRRLEAADGREIEVAAETMLLLALAAGTAELELDLPAGTARMVHWPWEATTPLAHALTVDLVLTDLLAAGVAGVRVCVGRAVRVAGEATHPSGWLLPVSHPFDHFGLACLLLHDAAISTAIAAGPVPDGSQAAVVVAERAWQAHLLAAEGVTLPAREVAALLPAGASALLLPAAGGEAQPVAGWRERLA